MIVKMVDKENDELDEKIKKQSKVEQIVVCLVCVFLLACVGCSLYVITERITTMKRSLDGLDLSKNNDKSRSSRYRRSLDGTFVNLGINKHGDKLRDRRSLKKRFDVCSLQHTSAIDSVLTEKIIKLEYNALCDKAKRTSSRQSTPAAVTPAKTRDKVFFPLDSNDGLKLLLRHEIMKQLLGKVKRNRNSTWGGVDSLEDEEDDRYAPQADLYFGGQLFTKENKEKSSSSHHTSAPGKKPTHSSQKTKPKAKEIALAPVSVPTPPEKVHTKDGDYEIPVFPEDYHSSGLIILPHSGIAEPFEIWFAPSKQKSRIDYYYGTDKTFQLGDDGQYGSAYKYVPMYNDKEKGFDGCWTVSGTKNRPIVPQIITPNITWFEYNGTAVYTGTLTTKWTYEYYAYGMRNAQTVWITVAKPHRPIRYEMYGFDMMLGSYYDHYVIEYISFSSLVEEKDTFTLPEGIKCSHWGFSLQSSLDINPMQEFTAFSPDRAMNKSFLYELYKEKERKKKRQEIEEKELSEDDNIRKHMFHNNARLINSHNRKNATFKLKPNPFLTLTNDELEAHHGQLEKDPRNHKGVKDVEKSDPLPAETSDIPDEIDWREYGAVSHVKGQGICGACYAFTAAGAAEGAWYRKTGRLVEVSAQQILDCSWGYGNHGCKGGHYATALSWIYSHGISTDKSYGKFLAQEGYCHFNDTWFGASIDGFSYIQPWNTTALKIAVWKYGPIAISINTRPLTFKFYSHGIYNDPKCRSNETTHSALVVGYGQENGEEYWIVKNSWSNTWGENGYIRVAMEDNLCGVTEYPVAAVVYHPQFVMPHKSKAKIGDIGRKVHAQSRFTSPQKTDNKKKQTEEIDDRDDDQKELMEQSDEDIKAVKATHVKKIDPKNREDFASIAVEKAEKADKEAKSRKGEKEKAGKIENEVKTEKEEKAEKEEKSDKAEKEEKAELTEKIISKPKKTPVDVTRHVKQNHPLGKFSPTVVISDQKAKTSQASTIIPQKKVSDLFPNMFNSDAAPESVADAINADAAKNSTEEGTNRHDLSESVSETTKEAAGLADDDKDPLAAAIDPERVNATISLFNDGILNKSLFDALTKDEKEEEIKAVDRKLKKMDEKKRKSKSRMNSEDEDERRKALEEERESELKEMLKDEHKMPPTLSSKMKNRKKINAPAPTVEQIQKEEKQKALEKEREEELAEVGKTKPTSEENVKENKGKDNAAHEENKSKENDKNDAASDDQNNQSVIEESSEADDHEDHISIETKDAYEKEKEESRKKALELKHKLELEEAWQKHLEKERKEQEKKLKAALENEKQKISEAKNYLPTEDVVKAAEEKEKLQIEMRAKEDELDREIENLESDEEERLQPSSYIEKKREKLVTQQKEIHKLLNQLEKLHVTGDKKSKTDASTTKSKKRKESLDPETIGLYTTAHALSNALMGSKKHFIQGEIKDTKLNDNYGISPLLNSKVVGKVVGKIKSKPFLGTKRTHLKTTSKSHNRYLGKIHDFSHEIKEISKMDKMINEFAKKSKMKSKSKKKLSNLQKAEVSSMDKLYSKIFHDLNMVQNKKHLMRGLHH